MPIFLFHGEYDNVINYKISKRTYDDMIKEGGFTQVTYKTERWLEHSLS